MIRVTIELLPQATPHSDQGKKCLGVLEIVNDLTGNAETGNYRIVLRVPEQADCCGRVTGFRRQKAGVCELVRRALQSVEPSPAPDSADQRPDRSA